MSLPAVLSFILALQVQIQPQQPRDTVPRPEPTGAGVIRGTVVAGDTGMPIRGATIMLMVIPLAGTSSAALMSQPMRPRQATTDAQGAFAFAQVPTGTYRISANPGQFAAQYLPGAYGAKRQGDLGAPINLAPGQTIEKAIVPLHRGGVIVGRVTDDMGMPVARVPVYALWFPAEGSRGVRNNSGVQTDDLGQFRLFGLQSGDYVVVAEARQNSFVSPNTIVNQDQENTGFLTTYYPGVADVASAQHLRAVAGRELGGVEMRLLQGRLYRVSGSVVDSQGKPAARVNGSLVQTGPGNSFTFGAGFMTDEQGQFQMQNVAPGNYRVVIRPRMEMVDAQPKTSGEAASVPIVVAADIEGLSITTTPGAAISGRIVFEVPPATPPKQMRVFASSAERDPMGIGPQPATVQPDMTFTIKGLMGELLLRANAPDAFMKSVTVGAADVTDTPHEFKNGDRVTIVLTSRASSVEGTVSDNTGQPPAGAAVILFPEDKSGWRSSSIRVRPGSVDPTGHYRIRGVLAGRYYVVAVPRQRLMTVGQMEASSFEDLVKDATEVVVGDDEQRTVDLRVIEPPGDK